LGSSVAYSCDSIESVIFLSRKSMIVNNKEKEMRRLFENFDKNVFAASL
jgi:hypothetical protein